ncbi:MAG TPA: cytochrome P450 [Acidimicrobiia bacterium]|nr:cytochrome P450 [Acidimicrobiia bacterium]
MQGIVELTLSTFDEVREAFRSRDLKQSLYDEGGVVMAGVLLTLHGDGHRARRRLENRLFRRDTFRRYERELVADIISGTLAPFVAARQADLVPVAYRVIMNLTALIAGLDRAGTAEETERLLEYTKLFSVGATLVHSTRDHAEVRAEVLAGLERFDAEFLAPSIERRVKLLDQVAAGTLDEEALPPDVLTTLLRNQDDLDLPHDLVRREVAFYLQAGSHSTANAFTHTMHELFTWAGTHPGALERARTDRLFLQRCSHEALRLFQASPIAARVAAAPVRLRSGLSIAEGTAVTLDLMAANRDPAVFGPDAGSFNPERPLPDGVAPWGHSFGGGMHACIGAELDGGLDPGATKDSPGDHLFGTVTTLAAAVLDAGVRPDPDRPPALDPDTSRPHFGSYPVLFGEAQS